MDVPGIVEDALEGEEVAAHVDLGGDDDLFVTPTRTLIYRSEGLLSDESVEAYDHDAERLSVSEGRRKTTLRLSYAIDGTEEFTLPSSRAEEAIPAILAGVLNANGVLDAGESVLATFRFSELTLVVTARRLVKHVGNAAWDEEFEEFHYDDVTGISEEAGSVATQIVLEVAGRAERIKTPNDRAPEVSQSLENALRAYYDVGEHEDLNAALAPEEDDEEAAADAGGGMSFEDGVAPLDAGDTSERVESLDVESSSGDEPADAASGDAAGGDAASGDATSSGGEPAGSAAGAADGAAGAASDPAPATDDAPAQQSPESSADGGGASASTADAPGASAETLSETATGTDSATAGDDAGAGGEPATDGSDASTGSAEADESDPFEKAGFQSATDASPDLEAEVEELREAVQKQNELLARHQETIEQLVEELRRGR